MPLERRGGYKDYWLAADVLEFTSHGYDGYMYDAGTCSAFDFTAYRVDCVTDFALDYLRTRTLQRPFFLFLSSIEPHHQNDHNRYEGPDGSKERFKDFVVPGDLVGTSGDWRENYPDYLGRSTPRREHGPPPGDAGGARLADDTLVLVHQRPRLALLHAQHGYKRLPRGLRAGADDRARAGI